MLRQSIIMLVLLAFLTQVSQAIADVHQSHQTTPEQHLDFDHDEHQISPQELPQKGSVSFDCHHCCHCHGSFHIYAMKADKTLILPRLTNTIANYIQDYTNPLASPLFRPPISS